MWVCCWQDCDLGSCSEMEVAPLVGDGGSSQLSALKCLVCVCERQRGHDDRKDHRDTVNRRENREDISNISKSEDGFLYPVAWS